MDILQVLGIRKQKPKPQNRESMQEFITQKLQGYLKREDLQKYLDEVQRDKEKLKIWNGLSARQKLKVLERIAMQRRVSNGKTYKR